MKKIFFFTHLVRRMKKIIHCCFPDQCKTLAEFIIEVKKRNVPVIVKGEFTPMFPSSDNDSSLQIIEPRGGWVSVALTGIGDESVWAVSFNIPIGFYNPDGDDNLLNLEKAAEKKKNMLEKHLQGFNIATA